MLPKKPKPTRIVAIPSNLFIETPLREKSLKIGFIARAIAIFRVEKVLLYGINNTEEEKVNANILKKILEYLECPQYLRKRFFKKDPALKYAGLLPPLRTPHHPLKHEKTRYREGIVTAIKGKYALIDVGLEKPVEVIIEEDFRIGNRVLVELFYNSRGKVLNAKIADRREIDVYWGYRVYLAEDLLNAIEKAHADFVVATSRWGTLVTKIEREFFDRIKKSKKMLVLFGSQKEGLFEISKKIGVRLEDVTDFIINFIPEQGTATVRTEEAILATFSIINFLNQHSLI